MVIKKTGATPARTDSGIELYLKRIFAIMFGAVGITAIISYLTISLNGMSLFVNSAGTGLSPLYYIVIFGTLGFVIWVQAKIFSMKPKTATALLALYAALIGFGMTPLIYFSLSVNPASIVQAFLIAALMFGCMALFGYKTSKNLNFLGTFLFIGMIGLVLTGVVSMIWPLGTMFATIVCLLGVLIFALFTAYDMQNLKRAYVEISDDNQRNQMAVLGALHLYISFIAMFQYILGFLNNR